MVSAQGILKMVHLSNDWGSGSSILIKELFLESLGIFLHTEERLREFFIFLLGKKSQTYLI